MRSWKMLLFAFTIHVLLFNLRIRAFFSIMACLNESKLNFLYYDLAAKGKVHNEFELGLAFNYLIVRSKVHVELIFIRIFSF